MKRVGFTVGILGILLITASPARAIQIPFDVTYVIDGQEIYVEGQEGSSGIVGVCHVNLQCTGVRVKESTSAVRAGTTTGTVSVAGAVCVLDQYAPCSETGEAFTGVTFTKSVVEAPDAFIDRIRATVEICYWVMAPQAYPTNCVPPVPVDSGGASTPAIGNLGELIPSSAGFSFST